MNRTAAICCLLALWASAMTPAGAQVGLPALPGLPALGNTLPETLRRAETPLSDLRRLQVRQLLREHRMVIDTDPDGQPVVRGQVGVLSPSGEALERARAAGYRVVGDQALAGLGLRVVMLSAPEGVSTRRALRQLRKLDPEGTYDYNYIYMQGGAATTSPAAQDKAAPAVAGHPATGVRIGLVDSGVDDTHPALAGSEIHRFGCEGRTIPHGHGTAVASLLAGQAEGFHGADPGAVLYAADIYCGDPTGGNTLLLARALDWMARERVPVINISLVGARSTLLTRLVQVMAGRGTLLVAAVGNDGPAAPPLYPAAYEEVIGVTAVDARLRVLPEACRGAHVAFAAPGADMRAAAPGGDWAAVRGTSFAAPIVAGLLAASLPQPDPEGARAALDRLSAAAVDLGPAGVDRDYGKGLVGADLRTPPDAQLARK
jgi:subtilisin family serine protease